VQIDGEQRVADDAGAWVPQSVEIPAGIRAVMWLSRFLAVATCVVFVIVLLKLVRGDVTVQWFLQWSVSAVFAAAVAWWIAFAIRAERAYVRPLLITLVASDLVISIPAAFIEPGVSTAQRDGMALLALLLLYLLGNRTVAQYYDHLRGRVQQTRG
jgi:hypothetical protein